MKRLNLATSKPFSIYFRYDYVLFTLTLVVALGIGVYSALAGDRNRSTNSYLMGNRALGTIPVAFSMFMSYISAIMVLGLYIIISYIEAVLKVSRTILTLCCFI